MAQICNILVKNFSLKYIVKKSVFSENILLRMFSCSLCDTFIFILHGIFVCDMGNIL